jgi:hypothetical protein
LRLTDPPSLDSPIRRRTSAPLSAR